MGEARGKVRKSKPKNKQCTECPVHFEPVNSLQKVCSPGCAYNRVKRINKRKASASINKQRKADKTALRARKQALKSKSDYLKDLQAVVNKYVRLCDRGKPCCSCDKPDDGTHQRHASHYRSTAACGALRFNLKNIHTSCQQCNTTKSGNILEYRIRLVKRFGEDYVQWLESQNQVVKYDIDYLL